jgi:hypothetical protein
MTVYIRKIEVKNWPDRNGTFHNISESGEVLNEHQLYDGFIYVLEEDYLAGVHKLERDVSAHFFVEKKIGEFTQKGKPCYYAMLDRSEIEVALDEIHTLEKHVIDYMDGQYFEREEGRKVSIIPAWPAHSCIDYLAERGYVKGRFRFDDDREPWFDGWHDPKSRWNGWANPYFTAEQRKQVLDFFNRRDHINFTSDEEFEDPEYNHWIEIAEQTEPNIHGLFGMGWGLTWNEEKDWG